MNLTKSEQIFYEGGPAKVDLLINLVAGMTLVGLPFFFGALVRALWLRYKITTKRISIDGGWFGKNQSQVVYSLITEVRSVSRGFGFYGDMVLFLKDGSKMEMRSIPNFKVFQPSTPILTKKIINYCDRLICYGEL